MKVKLPKDWIVVNSKTFPDRVYYFNVKTNKSSWEQPGNDNHNMEQIKQEKPNNRRGNKRKKNSSTDSSICSESRATTPEFKNQISPKRKRLSTNSQEKPQVPGKAVASTSKSNTTVEKESEIDTPQMKELRQKLAAKKSKENSPNKTSMTPLSVDKQTCKDTTISPKAQTPKSRKPSISPKMVPDESEKIFTPQMRAVYEKMKQKNALKTSTPNETPKIVKKSKIMACKSTPKRIATTPTSPPKRSGRSKKNIAKTRLDKLTKQLEAEVRDEAQEEPLPESSSAFFKALKNENLPSIDKNLKTRLKRLQTRVANNNAVSKTRKPAPNVPKEDTKDFSTAQPSVVLPTVENLVNDCAQNVFYEEMDWEPGEEEKILFEIRSVRTELCTDTQNPKKTTSGIDNLEFPRYSESTRTEGKRLYVVIDTNVFLTNLQAVEEIRDANFKIHGRPVVVIPWMVIHELDYIKDDKSKTRPESLRFKARKAINFLSNHFSSKHPRVVGQSREDMLNNKVKFAIECPDDEILQTCLQIRSSGNSVVLLTFDKNLGNKAMIHDITTLGRNDPLEKIDFLHAIDNNNRNSTSGLQNSLENENNQGTNNSSRSIFDEELRVADDIFEDAKEIVKQFLTRIVSTEMENLYGDGWQQHTILKPPWTIIQVLKCAIKHWIAAVSDAFPRRAESLLKELLEIFSSLPNAGRRLKDVQCVVQKCADLIEMVRAEKYPNLSDVASNQIDGLARKCNEFDQELTKMRLMDEIQLSDDVLEQETRALRGFQFFEQIYSKARDICGTAAEQVGMPCHFLYKPCNISNISELQSTAACVQNLLHALSHALQEKDDSYSNYVALKKLYDALINFLPDDKYDPSGPESHDLTLSDLYYCLKLKESVLKTGLHQFQDLSMHFCRLATYRCS